MLKLVSFIVFSESVRSLENLTKPIFEMKNLLITLFTLSALAFGCTANMDLAEPAKTSGLDNLHYYVIALKGIQKPDSQTLLDAKNQLSAFNNNHFAEQNLRLSSIYLGEGEESATPVMIVRRFADESLAQDYHKQLSKEKSTLFKASWNAIGTPISQTNYRNMLGAKSIEGFISD